MSMADLIPTLDDEGLANLRANAQRLENSEVARQAEQASALLPLIEDQDLAMAALEPHFAKALCHAVGIEKVDRHTMMAMPICDSMVCAKPALALGHERRLALRPHPAI